MDTMGEEKSSLSVLDYENIFLGALISGSIDGEEVTKAKREFFTSEENAKLFEVCHEIYTRSNWIDFVSVLSEFSKEVGPDKAKARLEKITTFVPVEFSSSGVIAELEAHYVKRQASVLMEKAKIAMVENPAMATEIMFALYEKVAKLSSSKISYDLPGEVDRTVEAVKDGVSEVQVIKTGLKAIDANMGGLSTQEVTIIGARPGHGKTTMSVALAHSILKADPSQVVVKFELEMSKEQIKRKFLSMIAKVSSYKMRINTITDEEKVLIEKAGEKMKAYANHLYIFDNIYDIGTMMRVCRETKATVCMVDFITLMDGLTDDMRRQIGNIVKMAKRFAKAHNMAWVFFSQLNRAAEGREGNRPTSGDLAESDYLTQLASEILLLFYKYKYSQSANDANRLSLIFDKARFASVTEQKIYFNPDVVLLRDL